MTPDEPASTTRHAGIGSAETGPEEELVQTVADSRAHWSLFLPSLAVAVVYAFAWGLLVLIGRGDGALAKIMFLVMAIAPPLLLVQAFLRYNSIGLALSRNHVLVARGWPRMAGIQIDLKSLSIAEVRASLLGKWLGTGRVVLLLKDGSTIGVSDLDQPNTIAEAINSHIPPIIS